MGISKVGEFGANERVASLARLFNDYPQVRRRIEEELEDGERVQQPKILNCALPIRFSLLYSDDLYSL